MKTKKYAILLAVVALALTACDTGNFSIPYVAVRVNNVHTPTTLADQMTVTIDLSDNANYPQTESYPSSLISGVYVRYGTDVRQDTLHNPSVFKLPKMNQPLEYGKYMYGGTIPNVTTGVQYSYYIEVRSSNSVWTNKKNGTKPYGQFIIPQ